MAVLVLARFGVMNNSSAGPKCHVEGGEIPLVRCHAVNVRILVSDQLYKSNQVSSDEHAD